MTNILKKVELFMAIITVDFNASDDIIQMKYKEITKNEQTIFAGHDKRSVS